MLTLLTKLKTWIAILAIAIALGGSALRASADTDQVYLYENGVPVLVTDCLIQDHQVYEDGYLIGILDENDNIENAGTIIGFVVSGS